MKNQPTDKELLHKENTSEPKQTEPNGECDPLRNWYPNAWVRRHRVEYKIPETVTDPVLFSPHLVPSLKHPLIIERGGKFAKKLLAHRLYTYAHFTSVLERDTVNEVTRRLARKYFWTELPEIFYRSAGRIYTDEGFHAQQSDEVLEMIAQQSGIEAKYLHTPQFMERLHELCSNLDSKKQQLAMNGFVIVSETLISSILADIPADPLVVMPVREFVREHARDEGTHHAYFSQLLQYGWPRLSQGDQEFLGPLLPRFVRWFLNPDLTWLRSFLKEEDFQSNLIERIIEESYPAASVSLDIRNAARHSIALFSKVGILESQDVKNAFLEQALL